MTLPDVPESRLAKEVVVIPLNGKRSPNWVRWQYIQNTLDGCGNNISATARRLGIHRRTLQRILQRGEPKQ